MGRVVDPVNFDNLVKGGVIFGLGHAMNCEITYSDGMAEQINYHAYEAMRLYQCPQIEVRRLENGREIRGIGEPPVPRKPRQNAGGGPSDPRSMISVSISTLSSAFLPAISLSNCSAAASPILRCGT